MHANNDYYQALSVLPSADDIVIRAAYRALAQRYHPDKWTGPGNDGSRRMAALNEAYAVLSEPAKRKAYDDARKASGAGETWDASEDKAGRAVEETSRTQEADWRVAVEYAPELQKHYRALRRISNRLALAYRQVLLATRRFRNCGEVAAELEKSFLEASFGTNDEISFFARSLLARRDKARLRALNRATAVLGPAFDPYRIILPLHYRTLSEEAKGRIRKMLALTTEPNRRWLLDSEVLPLIEALGGSIEKAERARPGGGVRAILPFCDKQFQSRSYLKIWVWESLCPPLMRLSGLA